MGCHTKTYMRISHMCLVAALAFPAAAQDAKEFVEAYQAGRNLDQSTAVALETRIAKRPGDLIARTKLIAYYTLSNQIDPAQAIPERRKHLLWLAQNHPDSWLWSQRSYGTSVHAKGGRLPDPEGFEQVRSVWLKHLASKSSSKIRENAASFLELGDRRTALDLIRQMKNPRYLGTAIALTLMGVTARDFDTGQPLAADPGVRESDLGRQLLLELEQASDAALVGGAGFWLSRDGAMLWNKGFQEWDYSPLAKSLLARAQRMEPERLDWFFANPELPKPGESRGVGQVRVGGTVMAEKIVNLVKPAIPPALSGIKGTVSLNIAVGHDGRVVKAVPTGGPRELYDITVHAVEQWLYKPTTISGIPIIVLSAVEIKFQ